MKQASWVTISIIILLAACSSNTPQKTQYYLLNSPTNNSHMAVTNKNSPLVNVKLLALPEYLKQPSLVLQLSSHQLHYSHFHMWAEPLQKSFTQALSQDLNKQDKRFNYVTDTTDTRKATTFNVIINVTAFHPTHQSKALLTGTFSIVNSATNSQINSYDFNVTVPLYQNGYEHAVEQMRNCIKQLADNIVNNIATQ